MNADDWKVLNMLPPSDDHDPFHEYVALDGRLTHRGRALLKFARLMRGEALRRAEKQ